MAKAFSLLTLLIVAALATTATPVAAQEAPVDVCAAAEEACVLLSEPCHPVERVCAWAAEKYFDILAIVNAPQDGGLDAVLDAALYPTLNSTAVWELELAPPPVEPPAVEPPAPDEPLAAEGDPLAIPLLVLAPGGAPGSAGALVPAEAAAAVDALVGGADLDAVAAASPADPRAEVSGLLAQLGTVTVPWNLVAAAPPAAPAAPAVLPEAAPDASGVAGRAPAEPGAPAARVAAAGAAPPLLRAAPLDDGASAGGPDATPQALAFEELFPFRLSVPLSAAALAFLGVLLLVPPLYHRLQRQQLLDQGARARLFELVAAHPGIHIEELARLTGLSRSTAVYHLRLLARHGHIQVMRNRKTVHYYPNNARHDPLEQGKRALLTSPRTREVAAQVLARPGILRGDLAAAAGITASTLTWHLTRLLEHALVEERLEQGRRALHPAPGLAELLAPWQRLVPGPADAPAAAPVVAAPAAPAAGMPAAFPAEVALPRA